MGLVGGFSVRESRFRQSKKISNLSAWTKGSM